MFKKSLLVSAVAATLAQTGFAQTNQENSVETVLVTAERVEKSILDITTTTNILDAEFIERENLRELNQIANFLPNVLVQEQAVSGQSFTIRGLGDEDGEQKLGSFFNGLNVTDRNFSGQFLHDIERVEVLKGPQTTAFGSFAVNGAINVVSKRANFDEFEGSIGAGYGSFDETRFEGVINVPVTDWLAFRVAGITVDKDGYSENLNGEDQNARVGDNLRFTASAEYGRFSGDFIVAYEDNDGPGIGFKSKYYLPDGGNGSASASDPLDFGGTPTTIQREMTLYQLKTRFEITDAIGLNYNFYYNDGDLYEYYEVDGGPLHIDERDYEYESEFTGNELFLTYDHERFNVLIGYNDLQTEQVYNSFRFYGDLQDATAQGVAQASVLNLPEGIAGFTDLSDDTVYPADFPLLELRQAVGDTTTALAPLVEFPPGSPIPGGVNLLFDATGFLQPLDNETSGYFANVDVHITEDLTLNAGLRDEETESNGVADTESEVLWKFGAHYTVTDQLSVYYSYAEGATPARGTVLVGESLERETIESHDVGFYWVTGNFQVQGAYFTYDYDNLVVGIDDPVTSLPTAINYGEASIGGFEFQGDYQINDMFAVFGSFGSNDAEYGQALGIDERINYEGNQYRNSPEWTYSAGLRAEWNKLRSTLSWTWQDDVYFEASNDPDSFQESFGILNLNVEYDVTEKLTVGLYGKNVLDEEYLIDAGNTAGSQGYPTLIEGTPANWLGTIRYRF